MKFLALFPLLVATLGGCLSQNDGLAAPAVVPAWTLRAGDTIEYEGTFDDVDVAYSIHVSGIDQVADDTMQVIEALRVSETLTSGAISSTRDVYYKTSDFAVAQYGGCVDDLYPWVEDCDDSRFEVEFGHAPGRLFLGAAWFWGRPVASIPTTLPFEAVGHWEVQPTAGKIVIGPIVDGVPASAWGGNLLLCEAGLSEVTVDLTTGLVETCRGNGVELRLVAAKPGDEVLIKPGVINGRNIHKATPTTESSPATRGATFFSYYLEDALDDAASDSEVSTVMAKDYWVIAATYDESQSCVQVGCFSESATWTIEIGNSASEAIEFRANLVFYAGQPLVPRVTVLGHGTWNASVPAQPKAQFGSSIDAAFDLATRNQLEITHVVLLLDSLLRSDESALEYYALIGLRPVGETYAYCAGCPHAVLDVHEGWLDYLTMDAPLRQPVA